MAEEALEKLYLLFTFVELCGPDLLKVAELRWNDYKDALQTCSAKTPA